MNVLSIIITVLLVLDAIGMIIIVLMQKTKTAGLGAAFGGDEGASFTSKGRAASKEAKLQKLTIILAIVFGVLALVLAVIS